jgi:23S rRNA pseudouridine1911/1915/1917 synthase
MDNQLISEKTENEDLFEHHRIEVDEGQNPVRIDKYIAGKLTNITRNKVQNAIDLGFVKVNGLEIKSNYKVRPKDLIIISLPEPPRDTDAKPENIPLDILFEDDDIIIVNKPAGMVVHPAFQNWTGTLVNALLYHFHDLPAHAGFDTRPGLVHRIDKDTSGLLVVAKNEVSLNQLARQFYHHTIKREYVAMVWGVPSPPAGTIKINIGRSLKDRRIVSAFPDGDLGREAVTNYRIVSDLRYVSLVECSLETGRTHQIRAHMKYMGHPLFNDHAYGGDKILKGTVFSKYKSFVENCFKFLPGQALHAKTLGFIHPISGKSMLFEARLPAGFTALIEKWEKYINYN